MPLSEIGRYYLTNPSSAPSYHDVVLVISKGSVVDFDGDVIVNAANTSCMGGGGVDAAITKAGGNALAKDRARLNIVGTSYDGMPIRCVEGNAVVTGPNRYGLLRSPYIIHAVGPNFRRLHYQGCATTEALKVKRSLLRDAYARSLDIANEIGLRRIAFSLLSAGVFRGPLSLHEILVLAVMTIQEWANDQKHAEASETKPAVREIHLCAFTSPECFVLKEICDHSLPAINS